MPQMAMPYSEEEYDDFCFEEEEEEKMDMDMEESIRAPAPKMDLSSRKKF